MRASLRHRGGHVRLVEFAALLAVVFAGSCATPIAPGYRILAESREIQYVPAGSRGPGTAPALEVRLRYTLENSGSIPLGYVDVLLPNPRSFGRHGLRIALDDRPASPQLLPPELRPDNPDTIRLPLDPAWRLKQRRRLEIEYLLSVPEDAGANITIGPESFHLGSRGWAAVLQPPKGFLVPFPRRPKRMTYSVRVPADFAVLARGRPKSRRKHRGEIEYRFQLLRDELPPYVVAGRYSQSGSASGGAVFWTLHPLKEDVTPAARKIAQAWEVLETDFGPLDIRAGFPHIIESAQLREHLAGKAGPAGASFPGGALVNPAAFALGVNSDGFLDIVTHALAHNWFGSQMYPDRFAAIGMGEGLPEYASIVIDEARGGVGARRARIAEFLARYDAARSHVAEKPLGFTLMTDPPAVRDISVDKAALFYADLEDEYGEAAIRQGLRHLVITMRGQQAGYDVLRSALEQSTGKNLAPVFSLWLYQAGVPAELRERYQKEQP